MLLRCGAVCPHMPSLGVSSLDLKAAFGRPPFFGPAVSAGARPVARKGRRNVLIYLVFGFDTRADVLSAFAVPVHRPSAMSAAPAKSAARRGVPRITQDSMAPNRGFIR